MRLLFSFLLAFVATAELASFAVAGPAIPPLKARVTDLTGTLTPEQVAAFEGQLKAFEAEKGTQLVLLMIPTLEGDSIEDYSLRLGEQWKIGRKGVDDGAILLIAKQDRKMRIEVGYGLEGALTDVESNRIIREIIGPEFKQGNFSGGISAGLLAIIGQIKGEELPAPPPSVAGSSSQAHSDSEAASIDLMQLFVVGALVLSSFLSPLKKSLGRFPTALLAAAIAAIFAYSFLAVVFASIVTFLTFVFALFTDQLARGSSRSSWGGGFSSGGSSSGGGFSGGGGSFGGGGSSGSW